MVTTNVAIQATTFMIIDAKLISVVNLSTQDNAKLLEQTKSDFKKTMNQNKYEPKVPKERQNQLLDVLIDSSFQGVNRPFLSFESEAQRESYKRYYFLTRQIKKCNVMINVQNVFDQSVRSDLISYDKIQIIAVYQRDDYTTCCLLDDNSIISLKTFIR